MRIKEIKPKANKILRSYYLDSEIIDIIDKISKKNKISKTQVIEYSIKKLTER